MSHPPKHVAQPPSEPKSGVPVPDVLLRRRAIPVFYAVDEELRVLFSCGVPPGPGMERLPPRVERIVSNLAEPACNGSDFAIGVDGDTVVRIVDCYSQTAKLKGVLVEKLRTSDPLREAVQRFGITARETQVLRLLLLGASTATIARRLQIAQTTAFDHLKRIAGKTTSHGRGTIVARVLGLLD